MPPPPPPPPPMPGGKRPGFMPKAPGFHGPPSVSMSGMRPKKKLKALHWEKVDAPQSTVWGQRGLTSEKKEELYQELSKKGVLDEVEKLFLAKEIKAIGKKQDKKDEKKQIISRDLMHNFQISMAKFSSVAVEDFVKLVIHCDTRILDDPVVMEFLQKNDFCDIPDNTAKLMAPYSKDWTGPNAEASKREQDPNELTREDQIFLYTAYELHSYWKSRMRALALTRTYETEYDEISNKLLEISRVSESLRDSTSLISVLGLILDIGNFMNDANKQANGFKLSTLSRLGMLKDDKNESTFADLVERIVRNQYSGWEGFTDEISGVITAQKINVEQLIQDAKRYIDNIKNVQMSLDAGNLSDPSRFHPEDKVAIIVQRSMKEARRKAEQLQVFLEDMQKSYDDIMAFYGEDPGDDSARREFFAKLANFVQEWKVSHDVPLSPIICSHSSHQLYMYTNATPSAPTSKTRPSKTNTAAMKSPCAANNTKTHSTRSPPPRCPQTPTRPNPPPRPAPWTISYRNSAPRSPRRATNEIAAGAQDSRTNTRCASRAGRRSRRLGLMWKARRRVEVSRRVRRVQRRRKKLSPRLKRRKVVKPTLTLRIARRRCWRVCSRRA
jgi:cytokinesis protein